MSRKTFQKAIQKSIVDVMRVVKMISIKNADPSFFRGQKMFFHISVAFPETTYISFLIITAFLRIQQVLSKGRVDRRYERKISTLNQALPKLDEWQDFLTNDRNKEQLCSLLADYFVSDEKVMGKRIYVTKGGLCLMKTLHNGQQMHNELCFNHRKADHRYAQS